MNRLISEKCRRITCLLAASVVWCFSNATNLRYPHMVSNIVCCWFTLTWNDSSSSCTVWEEIIPKRCIKMSIGDRSRYLHQNPITDVWMFQHRIEAFSSEYLLSDAHSLGHITDYVIKLSSRWEDHLVPTVLLWVKDAPKIYKDPDDVCAFIDKYITAVIPPIAPENEHHIKLMENLNNIHILTTVAETNLVILVFLNPLQQKP